MFSNRPYKEASRTMNCEIAGCEEVARFWISGIGCACAACAKEVIYDLQIDEDEDVRRI